MRGLLPTLMAVLYLSNEAFGQASVVDPNAFDYGAGRIDGSVAYRYVGQNVTACGFAMQPARVGFLTIGVSPHETVIVFPETDPVTVGLFRSKSLFECTFAPRSHLYS
jgi:hypothetical protein